MFKIYLIDIDVTIAIESELPDYKSRLVFTGKNAKFIKNRIIGATGMYGHSIGLSTTPLDLNAAIVKSEFNYRIVEGAQILDLPRQELKNDAIW